MRVIQIFVFLLLFGQVFAQTIPYGYSIDSIQIKGNYLGPLGSNYNNPGFEDAFRVIHFYKPSSYDSLTSPILWFMHGTGGSGASSGQLWDIAERRNALIVAPDAYYTRWQGATDFIYDTITCSNPPPNYFVNWTLSFPWLTNTFKEYYKWVLQRESRDSIPVYFTGFSAGGQVVNKYMFFRQFAPDSIPIVMAVSVSPAYYLFPTDSFNSAFLQTPCGLGYGPWNLSVDCFKTDSMSPLGGAYDTTDLEFICTDHVIQFYNENYGVLIGSSDNAYYVMCPGSGDSRLERAQNFYNFCDTNAISLGTTLKWQYAEVPGIGHNDSLMYHTCAVGDSIPIAERMLFETPWHPVPDSALVVDFEASTLRPKLSTGVVQFTNKTLNGVSYYWDFGDSTFSSQVNPQHTYLSPDTFSVKLTATSSTGCSYTLRKKYFIIVLDDTGIDENEPYATIRLFPNPAEKTLQFDLPRTESVSFYVSDITGRILQKGITENERIDISSLASGYYLLILQTENKWYRGRFVKE